MDCKMPKKRHVEYELGEVEMWGGWKWFASVERKDISVTGSKR